MRIRSLDASLDADAALTSDSTRRPGRHRRRGSRRARWTAATVAAACADVDISFARGTGELPGLGVVGSPFTEAVADNLPGRTVTTYAVDYSADYAQAGDGAGATDMSEHVVALAAECPDTLFVIGGYSQRATVTDIAAGIKTSLGSGTAIPTSLAPRVAAVVTFGNPIHLTDQDIKTASPADRRRRTSQDRDARFRAADRRAAPGAPCGGRADSRPPAMAG